MTSSDNPVISLQDSIKYINGFSDHQITEEDIIGIIYKIAKIHRNKTFSYFSEEDIEAQVMLICLQQIRYYEPSKAAGNTSINSIERWLNRVTKNRLSNYYRDNYSSINKNHRQTRINLNNCLDISLVNHIKRSKDLMDSEDPTYSLRFKEFKSFVESNLKEDLLEIYQACLNEENVSSYYKSKLSQELLRLINQWEVINKDIKHG